MALMLDAFPRLALATLPTAVAPLSRLGADVWIKRDDWTSPRYGGNKVRKLEFLLAEALERRATRIVTVGAAGSHHVLATACFAAPLGLGVTAVVIHQAPQPYVGRNLRLGAGWGVRYRPVAHPALLPAAVLAEWSPRCHWIPGGGSSPLGSLGYVAAGLELAAQIREGELPMPRAIVVATGTAGTHAGLLVGLAAAGLAIPVVGVRVVPRLMANERRVAALANATARLLGRPGRLRPGDVKLDHGHFGEGYGVPTAEAAALIAAAAGEGLVLEGTYTAKALAAAMAIARSGGPVLYWHTCDGADHGDEVAAADASALPSALKRYLRQRPMV